MYEELVMRLREAPHDWPDADLHYEAADAMEKLQKDLELSKSFEAFWKLEAEIALKKYQFDIAKKPKWNPVTDRLPDEIVLAYCRDGEIKILEYSHVKKYWEDDDGYYCVTDYITHRMPLPSVPTEE